MALLLKEFFDGVTDLYNSFEDGCSLRTLHLKASKLELMIGDRNGCISVWLPYDWFDNNVQEFDFYFCKKRHFTEKYGIADYEEYHKKFLAWFRNPDLSQAYSIECLIKVISLYRKAMKQEKSKEVKVWLERRIKNFDKRLQKIVRQ